MKKILALLLSFAISSAPLAQVINPGSPAQAGTGLTQAGSTLNVTYGTTAGTAKQGNAVVNVDRGGTGLATLTANNVLIGSGTAAVGLVSPTANVGYVLTSNGTTSAPTFQVAPTAAVSSVFGQTGAIPNLSGDAVTTGSSVVTLTNGTSTRTNLGLGTGNNVTFTNGTFSGTLSQGGKAISLGGNLTTAGAFTTTGANSIQLTSTGTTTLTLPTTGTLATTSNRLDAFASTTSAQLASVISDGTGTGPLVFRNSPTLVTPVLGAAIATTINGNTITAGSGTLTLAAAKTLTASNTLTLSGTDGSSVAFGTGGTVMYAGMIQVQDQETSGTNGGSASVGQQTRVLNTVTTNTISGASLASNQITLPAGTYRVWASAPAFKANGHRIRLRNVTDLTVLIDGTSGYSDSLLASQSDSIIQGRQFTLAATKVLDLQHYFTNASGAAGDLGLAVAMGDVEVYASVTIMKID